VAENTQHPWQGWCKRCPYDAPLPGEPQVWTGFSEAKVRAQVQQHIDRNHGGEGRIGVWRNPGVQWTEGL
jgi:hypothetical protein